MHICDSIGFTKGVRQWVADSLKLKDLLAKVKLAAHMVLHGDEPVAPSTLKEICHFFKGGFDVHEKVVLLGGVCHGELSSP